MGSRGDRSPGSPAHITYRTAAGAADFERTYDVFLRAANDLRTRSHRPHVRDTRARRTRAIAFREHAYRLDAGGFWIAENQCQDEAVGFGIATARPGFWHLNALHVVPEFQGAGVGSALLNRCLAYGRSDGTISTVISEAAQPVSNAMYVRAGMSQWLPLVHVECGVFQAERPRKVRVTTTDGPAEPATLATLNRIDESVLGFAREADHAFWTGLPDVSLHVLWAADIAVGYAYVSSFGGIGPCAVRSARYFGALIGHSVERAAQLGREHVSLVVPGTAAVAMAYLLGHGARFASEMTLLLTSRPFGRLERYLLPASDALF